MSNNGRILAKKRFERSARMAGEGMMASYTDVLIHRIRLGSFYRSAMKFWRAARKTLLVSRILKYVTLFFTVIESGAVALLSGAVFLVAIPVCLFPACILEIRASVLAKREARGVSKLCRDHHVVVLRGDYAMAAYMGDERVVIKVRSASFGIRYGENFLEVSPRLYMRIRGIAMASAARIIEVY